MILGMSIPAFTLLHVVITLIAIGSGLIAVGGMFASRRLPVTTALFLLTTVLTSVTGFLFPIHGFTPALGVGILSCVILLIALYAYYGKHLIGPWRWIYVITAIVALYFNVFVLVVQSFIKVAALNALAPTQAEPPFAIAQGCGAGNLYSHRDCCRNEVPAGERPPDLPSGSDGDWLFHVAATGPILPGWPGSPSRAGPPSPAIPNCACASSAKKPPWRTSSS